jgi:hypothetical protein
LPEGGVQRAFTPQPGVSLRDHRDVRKVFRPTGACCCYAVLCCAGSGGDEAWCYPIGFMHHSQWRATMRVIVVATPAAGRFGIEANARNAIDKIIKHL